MEQLTFSGHDSFHCRPFWLKKGYDHVSSGLSFNDADAVVELGVGKNMVSSIRYWLKAFGVSDEGDCITEFGRKLLANDGWDPYLEDIGSFWLLYHKLITCSRASIFSLIITELRNERPEFSVKNFSDFVLREKGEYNLNTLKTDFQVFCRTLYGQRNQKDLEESYSGVLSDLHLLRYIGRKSGAKAAVKDMWVLEKKEQPSLPPQILLYAIVAHEGFGQAISMHELTSLKGSPGNIFLLSTQGVMNKLTGLKEHGLFTKYDITLSTQAGITQLQFKDKKPSPLSILNDYYGN